MEIDEQDLIYLAQNGDKAAFMALYEKYADKIYVFVVGRIQNAADAEDILSLIWEKILVHLKNFEGSLEDSFKCWIFTIARNTIYRYYREHSPEKRFINLTTDLNLFQLDPEGCVDFFEKEKIRKLIERLPQKQKLAVHLKYFNDLKNKEIALHLNQSEKTVASNLSRALKKLFQWLQ